MTRDFIARNFSQVEKDNDSIKQAGFIDLGSRKGNKGDQSYDIPADVNLDRFQNVAIGCARLGVNFAQAELGAPLLPHSGKPFHAS